LAYTGDMFEFIQISTTWLDGRLMHHNWIGNSLAIHTNFIVLPLAAFVRPLGGPGLFVALALAFFAGGVWTVRCLRLLGVPRWIALGLGLVLLLMPLSIANFQCQLFGFY